MRGIPSTFADAIVGARPEAPIDLVRARAQHDALRATFEAIGVRVTMLDADDRCPDCCFIEDTAVVLRSVALITRPGAPSRRAETEAVARVLALDRPLSWMASPATLDGGDCMRVGDRLYVGRSSRTNTEGIARLAEVSATQGLRVVLVGLPPGVLHLKCICSPLDEERVLLAEGTMSGAIFEGRVVWAPASEAYAANVVTVGGHAIVPDGYPRTRDALEAAGFTTHAVSTTEAQKADGALTCQSILLGA